MTTFEGVNQENIKVTHGEYEYFKIAYEEQEYLQFVDVNQKFVELVNAERAKIGLSAVTLNEELNKAAQRHSIDLAFNNWYHEPNPHIGSDGSTRISRVQDTEYQYENPEGEPFENIAVGQFTPLEAFTDWLASPGHKENILTPNVNHLGVGHVFLPDDSGAINYFDYWTIVLAKGQPTPTPLLENLNLGTPNTGVNTFVETAGLDLSTNSNVEASGDTSAENNSNTNNGTSTPATGLDLPTNSNVEAASDTPAGNNSNTNNGTSDPTAADTSGSNTETPTKSAEAGTVTDTPQNKVVVSQPSNSPVQDSSASDLSQNLETPSSQPISTGSEDPSTPSQNNTDGATPTTANSSDQSKNTSVDAENQFTPANPDTGNTASNAAEVGENNTNSQEPVDSLPLLGTDEDDILVAGPEATTVAGGWGNDEITGSDHDDVLRGDLNERDPGGTEGGDDLIFGGAGNDRIGGKGGNDILVGGTGDDQIWGDNGDDTLRGGLGNDTLTGDNFSGGNGADTFILAAGEGTDLIMDFEIGIDRIELADGLTFEDLSFGQSDGTATISLTNGGDVLAELKNIMSESLTSELFTVI